jgi:hypothetical protein
MTDNATLKNIQAELYHSRAMLETIVEDPVPTVEELALMHELKERIAVLEKKEKEIGEAANELLRVLDSKGPNTEGHRYNTSGMNMEVAEMKARTGTPGIYPTEAVVFKPPGSEEVERIPEAEGVVYLDEYRKDGTGR